MLSPAGIPINVTAIFDGATPSHVAFSVYDDTAASPVLLLSPAVMANVVGNSYRGKFTPQAGKLYVVFMAVYTDTSFVTPDPAFAAVQQAVPVVAQYLTPPAQNVVGSIDCDAEAN